MLNKMDPRNTMTTKTWTWIKRHKSIRFSFSCIYNFPNINAHFFT